MTSAGSARASRRTARASDAFLQAAGCCRCCTDVLAAVLFFAMTVLGTASLGARCSFDRARAPAYIVRRQLRRLLLAKHSPASPSPLGSGVRGGRYRVVCRKSRLLRRSCEYRADTDRGPSPPGVLDPWVLLRARRVCLSRSRISNHTKKSINCYNERY